MKPDVVQTVVAEYTEATGNPVEQLELEYDGGILWMTVNYKRWLVYMTEEQLNSPRKRWHPIREALKADGTGVGKPTLATKLQDVADAIKDEPRKAVEAVIALLLTGKGDYLNSHPDLVGILDKHDDLATIYKEQTDKPEYTPKEDALHRLKVKGTRDWNLLPTSLHTIAPDQSTLDMGWRMIENELCECGYLYDNCQCDEKHGRYKQRIKLLDTEYHVKTAYPLPTRGLSHICGDECSLPTSEGMTTEERSKHICSIMLGEVTEDTPLDLLLMRTSGLQALGLPIKASREDLEARYRGLSCCLSNSSDVVKARLHKTYTEVSGFMDKVGRH